MPQRLLILLALLAFAAPLAPPVAAEQAGGASVQAFLDRQGGVLKSYQDGDQTAAMLIGSQADYYGLSPRLLLALLEATNSLLSNPSPPTSALEQPFGVAGPQGFAAQIEWATRELRAGLGPYQRPPLARFSDGSTLPLDVQQAPEGVAVQRFLAHGRTQPEWRAVVERFARAFAHYYNNELPAPAAQNLPAPLGGFLRQPWPAGARVQHLAFFDHAFPTVDSGDDGNGYVVDYLGRGGVQYDGHDGHDYVFLDQPIGTPILAAAPGIAYARTVRGNGVVILHDGGYETVYWHLDRFAAIFDRRLNSDRGVRVAAGDVIGTSGRSGFVQGTPHLHFEVRRHGRQVDPYGWYGNGPDPCLAYAGCAPSSWLWSDVLRGSYDFMPPHGPAVVDTEPPQATMVANPRRDLRLLVPFDDSTLQTLGQGFARVSGPVQFVGGRVGGGVRVPPEAGLSYPLGGNFHAEAGTISFWAVLQEEYPANATGRHYLVASSATPGDEAKVYSSTLALRHEQIDGARQWNFWTTSDDGLRDDLRAPNTLAPGPHHFALAWNRATGSKTLYIDGALVATRNAVALPTRLGDGLEIGRFADMFGHSGAAFDDLAIWGRALDATEVAALARQEKALAASAGLLKGRNLVIDVNASDASGIVAVQLGLDGRWAAPQPYYDSYRWWLPPVSGTVTIGARFFDRSSNSTIVSQTLRVDARSVVYLPFFGGSQPR